MKEKENFLWSNIYQKKIRKSEHEISAFLDEEEVILHTKTGIYYSLNEIGAEIWREIENVRTIEEIQQHLNQIYSVEPDLLQKDLLDLIRDLHQNDLIEFVS